MWVLYFLGDAWGTGVALLLLRCLATHCRGFAVILFYKSSLGLWALCIALQSLLGCLPS